MEVEINEQNYKDKEDIQVNYFNTGKESKPEGIEMMELNIAKEIYDKHIYNFDYIYEFFKEQVILSKKVSCPFYNNIMNVIRKINMV